MQVQEKVMVFGTARLRKATLKTRLVNLPSKEDAG